MSWKRVNKTRYERALQTGYTLAVELGDGDIDQPRFLIGKCEFHGHEVWNACFNIESVTEAQRATEAGFACWFKTETARVVHELEGG